MATISSWAPPTGAATIEARAVADRSQVAYAHMTVWRNAAVC